MNKPNFDALISEYRSEGIGPMLYEFISDVVQHTVKRFPAAIYSPNQVWDRDAIGALCHDFMIKRLLERGWLEHYLISLETAEQLRYVLQRDVRHYLINRRKKDEFTGIVRRVRQILTTQQIFTNCGSESSWGLNEWENRISVQNLHDVVRAMYRTSLPPLTLYKANSRKLSHLISTKDLQLLLLSTFQDLGLCVDFNLLIDALRIRLNLPDLQEVSLDEPFDVENQVVTLGDKTASELDIPDVELEDIAQRIYTRLTPRQRLVLSIYLSLQTPTLEGLGAELNVSKSTISNDLNVIQKHIAATDISEREAQRLFELLSELCLAND